MITALGGQSQVDVCEFQDGEHIERACLKQTLTGPQKDRPHLDVKHDQGEFMYL